MSVLSIWDCHESFWENRPFVTWQLLRRNGFYEQEVKRCIKYSRSVFVPRRSYPPSSKTERLEYWHNSIELFTELLSQPGKIDEFKQGLLLPPIHVEPPQPDQLAFRHWLMNEELRRKVPYCDLFLGQLTRSGRPLPVAMMKKYRFRLRFKTIAATPQCALMTIRRNGGVIDISMPFHARPDGSLVVPLLDPRVDFPPSWFLPRFNQSPPETTNRKAYGAYLYDRSFQPVHVGRGRPKVIKEALRVWDLSESGMPDSEIARSLLGLHYSFPDKPNNLQRIHDLKVAARKEIQGSFPISTKK